jgi:OOP family OmpA-OmpF porin
MFWPGGKWREIEQNVKESVTLGLQKQGFNWTEVHTRDRGRDVMLSGSAPSEEEKQRAIKVASDLVLDQRGNTVARIVEWEGEIKPPVIPLSDGNIQMSVVDGKVSLAGVVSSEEERNQLLAAAAAQYGVDNVFDQLVVRQYIKPQDELIELIPSFGLNDGVLRLLDGQLTITGIVETDAIKNSIGSRLIAMLGDEYSLLNRIKVVPVAPPEPDPREVCQAKVIEYMSITKVYFESSKDLIKEESYALLSSIASVLAECPDAAIEVVGHTDSTGSESFNVPLSKSRAQSVVDYLLGEGIANDRLTSVGYGSEKPIADNETEQGRAVNRRIEFIVK